MHEERRGSHDRIVLKRVVVDDSTQPLGARAQRRRELRALVVVDETHARARVRHKQLLDRRGRRQAPVVERERCFRVDLARGGRCATKDKCGADGGSDRVQVGCRVSDKQYASSQFKWQRWQAEDWQWPAKTMKYVREPRTLLPVRAHHQGDVA